MVGTVQCSIECNDQFYCENNFCRPLCKEFEDYPHPYIVASDVLIILATSIGVVTVLATLVISCLRYKLMYVADVLVLFYNYTC